MCGKAQRFFRAQCEKTEPDQTLVNNLMCVIDEHAVIRGKRMACDDQVEYDIRAHSHRSVRSAAEFHPDPLAGCCRRALNPTSPSVVLERANTIVNMRQNAIMVTAIVDHRGRRSDGECATNLTPRSA
jgi:hypothetical protein